MLPNVEDTKKTAVSVHLRASGQKWALKLFIQLKAILVITLLATSSHSVGGSFQISRRPNQINYGAGLQRTFRVDKSDD